MDTTINGIPVQIVAVTIERHLELLMKETDRERRTLRKSLGFHALYSADPNAKVMLPVHLVETEDVERDKQT